MAVVFFVLIGLNLMIRLQTVIYKGFTSRKTRKSVEVSAPAAAAPIVAPVVNEKLKLINVDEKTAAIVMAIVCDESNIPPEELYFKSIVGLDKVTE